MWTLVAANMAAIAIGVYQGWSLSELMLTYWAQSVIIGVSYVARIRSLEKFSTKNFRMNGRAVEPNDQNKRNVAGFFLLHFGFFHVVYFLFIVQDTPSGLLLGPGLLVCTLAFAVNHNFSYRYHRELDRRGTPNIGTLMFTPYVRIVPMHLTILLGATLGSGKGLLLFGVLKTLADVVMHIIEHRRLGHREQTLQLSGSR